MPATASSAFISYSREDSEFALRLAQDLKAAGANVWLDQTDITPGHPWDNAIEDALTNAPEMLVILSPGSAKSQNVRDEIGLTREAAPPHPLANASSSAVGRTLRPTTAPMTLGASPTSSTTSA